MNFSLLRSIFFAFIFICLFPLQISAHPHLFVESSAEVVWNGAELSGCWLEWSFDLYFSAEIIGAYDADKNGIFSENETSQVFNKAFINLRHYYYFTFIRQGDVRTNPAEVKNFSVRQKDGIMTYRFFIDLSSLKKETFAIAVYDYTYFCEISYTKTNPVTLKYDPSKVKVSYLIEENKDFPVYYNPLGSYNDTTIYYSWKPGLQTYYPREIRIRYD